MSEEEESTFPEEQCTGINEHAHCAFLLKNLVQARIISKEYRQKMFNHVILKNDRHFQSMLMFMEMITGSTAELLSLPTFGYPVWHEKAGQLYLADIDTIHLIEVINSAVNILQLPRHYQTVANVETGSTSAESFTLVTAPCISPGFCCIRAEIPEAKEAIFCTHECLRLVFDKDDGENAAVCQEGNVLSSDKVPCFLIQSWPDCAQSIFTRAHNVWPDQATLTVIRRNTKLAAVRKAHHSSQHPDIEFRLSFSLPEVVLARSLPDTVRHVYFTVKQLRQVTDLASTNLKSYHLKTLLFWVASREDITTWGELNFKEYVVLFLKEITRAFEEQHLSNFFIPESNLLSHLKAADCHEVVLQMNAVVSRLCGVVLDIQSSLAINWLDQNTIEADEEYQKALKYFRRFSKAETPQQKTIEKSATLRHFEQSFSLKPQFVGYLTEYGHFLWCAGEEVPAFVQWLNVLVLYDPETRSATDHYKDDCCRLVPILRLELQNYTEGFAPYTTGVLALYFLITKTEFNETSGKAVLQRLESDPRINHYLHAFINPEFIDKLLQQDGSTRLKKWCSLLLNLNSPEAVFSFLYSEENSTYIPPLDTQRRTHRGDLVGAFALQITHAKQELTHRGMRKHVHDIALAVCEYTKVWMPSCRRKRRHSYHGTTQVSCKYLKIDVAVMMNSLYTIHTTDDVCLEEIEETHEKVTRRNLTVAELTRFMLDGDEDAKSISEKILEGGESEMDKQLDEWDRLVGRTEESDDSSSETDESGSCGESSSS